VAATPVRVNATGPHIRVGRGRTSRPRTRFQLQPAGCRAADTVIGAARALP